MKIIVPMAGRGSRLRPHTLTVPKPLIPIAGKPIVHRLVEDIAGVLRQEVDEIAFVIHPDFGPQVEKELIGIAENLGAKGSVFYQTQPLGTAHAILSAAQALSGPLVIAYADTLFRADFALEMQADSVVWVKQVDDPSAFGVVKVGPDNRITDFIEKPADFVSDLAIIGIYYFKDGENLKRELQYLVDNNIEKGGEYQLTDALENMKQKGLVFMPGKVDEWMDCGNKNVTVETNTRMLGFLQAEGAPLVHASATLENSTIIPPCYIAEGVVLKNSTIGPNVSLGKNTHVWDSTLSDSLVQTHTHIKNATLKNAMIGNHVKYNGAFESVSLGDYSEIQ